MKEKRWAVKHHANLNQNEEQHLNIQHSQICHTVRAALNIYLI